MQSKKKIGILLAVVIMFSVIVLFLSLEKMERTDENETGGIDRFSGADRMNKIMRTDSEVQNLIRDRHVSNGGIFNETGESTAYISVPPFRQNASDSYSANPDISTPFTDANGDIIGWENITNTTGWETYKIMIDTPNETVKSVEKVDQFPDWIGQIKVRSLPASSVHSLNIG